MFWVWMWNANSYLETTREITSVCQVVISKTFAPKNVAMCYSGRPLSFVGLLWTGMSPAFRVHSVHTHQYVVQRPLWIHCNIQCTHTSMWCSDRSGYIAGTNLRQFPLLRCYSAQIAGHLPTFWTTYQYHRQEAGTDRFSRNVGNLLSMYAERRSERSNIRFTPRSKAEITYGRIC